LPALRIAEQAVTQSPHSPATPVSLSPSRTDSIRSDLSETTQFDAAELGSAIARSGLDTTSRVDVPALPNARRLSVRTLGTSTEQVAVMPAPASEQPTGPSRPPQKLSTLLARLGVLTARHPVGVISGAAFGSIVMVVFFVGAAQLVKSHSTRGPSAATRTAAPSELTTPRPPNTPAKAPSLGSVATPSTVASAVVARPPSSTNGTEQAGAVDPYTSVAAGHLFAGRLTEAEQAYRDLAQRHPENETYPVLARVLGRRNSGDCRTNGTSKNSCPTVKQ
jgi:hypothetical protein